LFLLVGALLNLGFGIYILCHNPKRIQNRIFSLFIFFLVTWTSVNFLISISDNIEVIGVLGKLAYVIGSIIPVALAVFIYVFPRINKDISTTPLYLLFTVCVFLIILVIFTPLIQSGVKVTEASFRPILGPWYSLFAIYEGLGMVYCLWFLYTKWKFSQNKYEQLQIKFIFFGILIATSIALIGSVILPLFDISAMIYLGPTLTVVIIGFATYAIVRYRLFDITIVIKKTAIYTLLTGIVTAFYVIGVLLAERLFRETVGYQTFFPAIFAALVVAFLFLPLREKIQTFVDKIFGKKKYEYQGVLKEVGKELSKVLPFQKLLKYILKSITETMGVNGGAVYLSEANIFRLKSLLGNFPHKSTRISFDDSIISWMMDKKDVIIKDELERMGESMQIQTMKKSLNKVGADVAVPIIRENILTGIIFLKGKSSGDVFTGEDIDLLLTIASQAGVAIENARLYTQVEQTKIYQENILKNLANAVIVTDKDDRIRIFNEKAQKITAISASDAIGKNYKKVLPKELSQAIGDVKKFGKGFSSYEIEYARDEEKTDKTKPLVLGVGTVAMKGKNNKVNGVILVLADLTEIRTLEHQLNRAEELATVGTLAAGMAHEIKNPLVAINTFFELLPQKYDDPQFRKEFSASACEEVKKINDLIHRLLNFAQPKAPNFMLNHIHKCIDESLKFMKTKFESYGIEIIKKYSPDVPENYIDKIRFDEIILNLLLNAIEAMEKGGKLYIITSYEKTDNGRQILLKVQDTGEGMPPENLSRVFDPFFTTKDGGTGLGLAIVYRAVVDHGGNIEVESEVGRGTTFLISLPLFLKAFRRNLASIKP